MPRLQRRQATIMSADVAGYTSMMAKNDVLTLRALLECIERIAALVRAFNGRVVDSVGDNLLAEFPSERTALCCANEVQLMLLERNRDCDPAERMEFRIGLSSGCVYVGYESRLPTSCWNRLAAIGSLEPNQVCETTCGKTDAT